MGLPSKEEKILELFFNESSREWHFEDIVKNVKMSRDKVNKWLIKLAKEGVVKKIKEKGKMPHYIADFSSPDYKNRKRIYILNKFYKTGFLNHLMKLNANTVIIFGSFSRSDWHKESDIDLFIYGNGEELEQGKYEKKLGREIQTFICRTKEDLKKFRKGLLKNILSGYTVKGSFDFIRGIYA